VADAGLFLITKYGQGWAKSDNAGPLTQETRKLLNKLSIPGRRNLYTLRHTSRAVADEAKDQPAADYIMGHEVAHMSSVYRERISDDRLKAVTDHVRAWRFEPKVKGSTNGTADEARNGFAIAWGGRGCRAAERKNVPAARPRSAAPRALAGSLRRPRPVPELLPALHPRVELPHRRLQQATRRRQPLPAVARVVHPTRVVPQIRQRLRRQPPGGGRGKN
jgi:hypothetical protein